MKVSHSETYEHEEQSQEQWRYNTSVSFQISSRLKVAFGRAVSARSSNDRNNCQFLHLNFHGSIITENEKSSSFISNGFVRISRYVFHNKMYISSYV